MVLVILLVPVFFSLAKLKPEFGGLSLHEIYNIYYNTWPVGHSSNQRSVAYKILNSLGFCFAGIFTVWMSFLTTTFMTTMETRWPRATKPVFAWKTLCVMKEIAPNTPATESKVIYQHSCPLPMKTPVNFPKPYISIAPPLSRD